MKNVTNIYQACPVCGGQGTLDKLRHTNMGSFTNVCNVCNGTGIISKITGRPPRLEYTTNTLPYNED